MIHIQRTQYISDKSSIDKGLYFPSWHYKIFVSNHTHNKAYLFSTLSFFYENSREMIKSSKNFFRKKKKDLSFTKAENCGILRTFSRETYLKLSDERK